METTSSSSSSSSGPAIPSVMMGRRSVTLEEGPTAVSSTSSSSTSSSSVAVRPTRRLLRVVVVDYPTGIALFHHAWAWKADPNLPGVAKVIVALYKLSQSLGGRGDTNYVLFDPPPEGRRRSQQDLYSLKAKRASGGAGLRPMMAASRARKPRIRCVFSRVDHVVVGLFHEIGDKLELPKQCGDAILRTFVKLYGEKLAAMRHIFEDMIDEKKVRDCSMTQEQVLEVFAQFESHLSTIEEVGEFNRVRSAKESSSAGTYTFSFSLTDDTVELIKRERQKQREEDERSSAGEEGVSTDRSQPLRPSSLAHSSGPPAVVESETDSPVPLKENGGSQREDDETEREGSITPSSELREKKTERKNSNKEAKKEQQTKKKEKKNKKKKEGRKEGKEPKKVKDKEQKKMLASV